LLEEQMFKMVMCATLSMAAIAVTLPTAKAAPPEFCREYADAAVNQVRGALASPVCARHISGTRWAPEHRVHFDWCLLQPIPVVQAERAARTEFLRGCRG